MNPNSDPQSDWLDRASRLPKPLMREAARQCSLDAALAALEERHVLPPPRMAKYRRWINLHTMGWAACWAAITFFQLQAPPRSPRPQTPPLAAWPSPPQDPEMARLMASLYPQAPLAPTSMTFKTSDDSLWIPHP